MATQDFSEFFGGASSPSVPSSDNSNFSEFFGNTPATQTNVSQIPSVSTKKENPLWTMGKNIAKNLPSTVISGFTSVGDVMARAGTTLGTGLSKLLPAPKFKVPEQDIEKFNQAKKNVLSFKKGFQKEVTLPFQDTPIMKSATVWSSPKQAIGDIAEATLDTVTGIYGLSLGKNIGKSILKEAGKELAEKGSKVAIKSVTKNILTSIKNRGIKNIAKTVARDAGVGAGYGVATEMQNKQSTLGSIAKSGLTGAIIGSTLPHLIGGTAKIVGKGISLSNKQIAKAAESVASKLEKYVEESKVPKIITTKETPLISTALEKTPINLKVNLASKTAAGLRTALAIPSAFRNTILDKYDPIVSFNEKANKEGATIHDLEEAVRGTKHRAGGIATEQLNEYTGMIKNYGKDNWNNIKEYARLLDDTDRLNRGNAIVGKIINKNGTEIKVSRTAEDVANEMSQLKSRLNPEQMAIVEKGQKDLNIFYDNILKTAVESGRITPESYAAMKKAHPNYALREVADYINQSAGQGKGNSFNVTRSGYYKAEGSVRELSDLDVATVRYLYKEALQNEKNTAMGKIMSAIKNMGVGKALRTAENVKARTEAFKKLSIEKQNKNTLINQIKELSVFGKKAEIKIEETIESKKGSKEIKKLIKSIKEADKERTSLLDEAQTLASEFEPTTPIKKLITKAETQDKNVKTKLIQLKKLQEKINFEKTLTFAQQTDVVKRIRETSKQIVEMVNKSKTTAKELWAEAKSASDVAIKGVDIPEGYEKMSYFNNGIREDWLVPSDVGRALKHMDGESSGFILKWLNNTKDASENIFTKGLRTLSTFSATAIKNLAVNWNIVFGGFSNPMRDIQTVQLTSNASLKDIGESLLKTITGKHDPELIKLAEKSGALQGNIFKEYSSPEEILMNVLNDDTGVKGIKNIIKHPLKAIESVGQKMETMTRLAVFKRELLRGSPLDQAAKAARNATVDFSKSGSITEIINKFVPFLNARIQGFSNLLSAVKKNPTRATRVLLWTAAYPAVLLSAYNNRYKSFTNVPDYEKRKYWILMVGESNGRSLNGTSIKIPHYVKIPKGEAQQAVSNVTDRVLDLSKNKYPDSTNKFLYNLFKDFSPVTESSILPAGGQQAVEVLTNYSFFKDAPIVPEYIQIGNKWIKSSEIPSKEQYNDKTSEIAKYIGEALGWSPIKVDYIIKQGLLNDVIRLYDLPFKGFKGTGTFEKTSELPLARTILGVSNYGESLRKTAYEEEQKKIKNTKRIETLRRIQEQMNKIKSK